MSVESAVSVESANNELSARDCAPVIAFAKGFIFFAEVIVSALLSCVRKERLAD